MTLLDRIDHDTVRASAARPTTDRLNRRGRLQPRDPRTPRRSTLVALVLAGATMLTLDGGAGALEPVRRAVGEVVGPVQTAVSTLARPITVVPEVLRTNGSLREEVDALREDNAALRQQVATSDYDRNRLEAYDGLTATAQEIGYALVPARVVGIGAAQSFSHTATIDAGSSSGIAPDMTVVNADGLVGRVLRVTSTTATVLLASDADSVVGGRVGDSMDVGFVSGSGDLGGHLDLELIDQGALPNRGDAVVTWGSDKGAPYVSGVPIGAVTAVYANLRDSSQRAEIEPFVDFGSLDVVGVVVPSGTASDRAVIEVDGSLQ